MEFTLSEEQLLLQNLARDFSQKEIKPTVAKYDQEPDPIKRFPWEWWQKAHKLGLVHLPMDVKWGGGGADLLTQVIVCEEIGAGDCSFGKAFGSHYQKTHYLTDLCNEEQQQEFIPWFMNDDSIVIADCSTEPEHGSDHHLPYDAPGAAMKTFAYRDGDDYVINGMKHFVTLAAVAKLFVVWVRTDKNKPLTQACSGFLVRLGTPGLSIGHVSDEMGGRLDCRAEIIFDNVRVNAKYRIGEENMAFGPRMAVFFPDTLNTTAAGIGEARTCYEETLAYAKTRVQGGKPIIQHINIGTRLVDMKFTIEAARAIIQKLAWQADNQRDFNPMMVFASHAFVSELLNKFYIDALEIWAGMGVQKEVPIERYFRNHFATNHGGGTPGLAKINAMQGL